jgi:hypothetical protein
MNVMYMARQGNLTFVSTALVRTPSGFAAGACTAVNVRSRNVVRKPKGTRLQGGFGVSGNRETTVRVGPQTLVTRHHPHELAVTDKKLAQYITLHLQLLG